MTLNRFLVKTLILALVVSLLIVTPGCMERFDSLNESNLEVADLRVTGLEDLEEHEDVMKVNIAANVTNNEEDIKEKILEFKLEGEETKNETEKVRVPPNETQIALASFYLESEGNYTIICEELSETFRLTETKLFWGGGAGGGPSPPVNPNGGGGGAVGGEYTVLESAQRDIQLSDEDGDVYCDATVTVEILEAALGLDYRIRVTTGYVYFDPVGDDSVNIISGHAGVYYPGDVSPIPGCGDGTGEIFSGEGDSAEITYYYIEEEDEYSVYHAKGRIEAFIGEMNVDKDEVVFEVDLDQETIKDITPPS